MNAFDDIHGKPRGLALPPYNPTIEVFPFDSLSILLLKIKISLSRILFRLVVSLKDDIPGTTKSHLKLLCYLVVDFFPSANDILINFVKISFSNIIIYISSVIICVGNMDCSISIRVVNL